MILCRHLCRQPEVEPVGPGIRSMTAHTRSVRASQRPVRSARGTPCPRVGGQPAVGIMPRPSLAARRATGGARGPTGWRSARAPAARRSSAGRWGPRREQTRSRRAAAGRRPVRKVRPAQRRGVGRAGRVVPDRRDRVQGSRRLAGSVVSRERRGSGQHRRREQEDSRRGARVPAGSADPVQAGRASAAAAHGPRPVCCGPVRTSWPSCASARRPWAQPMGDRCCTGSATPSMRLKTTRQGRCWARPRAIRARRCARRRLRRWPGGARRRRREGEAWATRTPRSEHGRQSCQSGRSPTPCTPGQWPRLGPARRC